MYSPLPDNEPTFVLRLSEFLMTAVDFLIWHLEHSRHEMQCRNEGQVSLSLKKDAAPETRGGVILLAFSAESAVNPKR
jgi:hypothetical protein